MTIRILEFLRGSRGIVVGSSMMVDGDHGNAQFAGKRALTAQVGTLRHHCGNILGARVKASRVAWLTMTGTWLVEVRPSGWERRSLEQFDRGR